MTRWASRSNGISNSALFKGAHYPSADLERLHKYMLEIEGVDAISDEMRAVVESEWPELVHKPPPKQPQS
jgi:hypothetical protein